MPVNDRSLTLHQVLSYFHCFVLQVIMKENRKYSLYLPYTLINTVSTERVLCLGMRLLSSKNQGLLNYYTLEKCPLFPNCKVVVLDH